MTSSRHIPIFDGHNDVLLRLYRRGGTDAPQAFLEGKAKGQLNLRMARQGGLAGGLFAIFVPSTDGATLSQNGDSDALSPHAVELTQAQRIVFSMMSLLLRIERESRSRSRPVLLINAQIGCPAFGGKREEWFDPVRTI
jgi:membrane dipeptidase